MSDTGLFILGFLITIPAAAGIVLLLYAAVLDGRENDRINLAAQLATEQSEPTVAATPTGSK